MRWINSDGPLCAPGDIAQRLEAVIQTIRLKMTPEAADKALVKSLVMCDKESRETPPRKGPSTCRN